MSELLSMPDSVYDFVNTFIEEHGEYPSYEDFENEFGQRYPEWSQRMPDTRYEIDEGVDDEEFISSPRTLDDEYKERGLNQMRDFW